MKHKCEVTSSRNWTSNCGKKARFKIVDYECSIERNEKLEPFWVCDDCIKHFISKNENEPHYILLEVCTLNWK